MTEEVFCGAEKCSVNCPAYGDDYGSGHSCKLVNAKIKAIEAEEKAYEKMEEYYSLKIEGDK